MGRASGKVINMDSKKSASQRDAVHFLSGVKQEFNRIEWTSQDELKSYTKIVVGSTFIFGLSIYIIDLALRGALDLINEGFKFLIG